MTALPPAARKQPRAHAPCVPCGFSLGRQLPRQRGAGSRGQALVGRREATPVGSRLQPQPLRLPGQMPRHPPPGWWPLGRSGAGRDSDSLGFEGTSACSQGGGLRRSSGLACRRRVGGGDCRASVGGTQLSPPGMRPPGVRLWLTCPLELSSSLSVWEASRRGRRGERKQRALAPRGAGPPAQAHPQSAILQNCRNRCGKVGREIP